MIDVCHLITSLDMGGAQRTLVRLLRGTDRGAFRSRVVTLVDGGALAEDVTGLEVPLAGLGLRSGSVDPRGVSRLRRRLAERPPDVLLTWLHHADLLGALASRHSGARLVWNLRSAGQADDARPMRRAVARACAWLSGRPAAVVANSRAGIELHRARGYHPARWEWIPNGFASVPAVADAARAHARRELGIAAEEAVVLVLSRWHPSKGLEVLADALRRAPVPRTTVLLAGEGLEEGNEALARLMVPATGVRVRALGPRRDADTLRAASDVALSPSRFEGFPNAVGEALAAGLVCVATDAGESCTLVGEAGRIVPPGDALALAGALREVLALGPGARAALGAAGRARVQREFSVERMVARYEQLFRELVERVPCAV